VPQIVVGWHFRDRYAVTLWNPERRTAGSALWVPHPHDDVLITIACNLCNHGTEVVSVYATFGDKVRHIYGDSYFAVEKERGPPARVHGRVIGETSWGARGGLLWFDEPRGGESVCCPPFRLQTFMRWTTHGWRVVARRRVSPNDDPMFNGR